MKKKIYFKEHWLADEFKFELFWKRHRWMPWRKMDRKVDVLEKMSMLQSYSSGYDVWFWDEIFSQFVPLKCIL